MLKKQSSNIKGKKILISGGAGFIGSYLCESLVKYNKVTVLDNFRRNALSYTTIKKHPNLTLTTGNVLEENDVAKAIDDQEYVIHLAAVAGVSSYYKNPLQTLEVDALGTYKVLKIASEKKIKQVILFSTSEVYGPLAQNVTELSPTIQGPATDSRWSYAVGKLIGDHFAFAFSKMKSLPITIVRPFNIYGPRQVGEGAIQIFITQALHNKPLTIRGSGVQVRAWCYIDDFIDAILSIIGNKKAYNQIFNIGNPNAICTTKELADYILSVTGSSSKITYTKSSITDIEQRIPSIKKAQNLLNFFPKTSLKTGLINTSKWFKQNADN